LETILKIFFQIAQPSGHVYEIPVAVVANHRAAYYHANNPDEFPTLESAMVDTVELFKDDAREIRDWAGNNMNWPDLERDAKLIRFTPPATDSWFEGEWSYHEHRAIMGELDGAAIMLSPVEAIVTAMQESAQVCNVTVLNAQDGKAFGAVAVIMGGQQVVDIFLNTLTQTTNHIAGGATEPAPTH
jgi:hypothetical protein